jgi:MtN3 and saliva related transmembrane protein
MISLVTLVGLLAAVCTTVSYVPQLKKVWQTRSTEDISLKMFLILAAGIALWVIYGVLKSDIVIVLANAVSFLLLSGIFLQAARDVVHEPRGAVKDKTAQNGMRR